MISKYKAVLTSKISLPFVQFNLTSKSNNSFKKQTNNNKIILDHNQTLFNNYSLKKYFNFSSLKANPNTTAKIINPYQKLLKSYFAKRFDYSTQQLIQTLTNILQIANKYNQNKYNNNKSQTTIIKFSITALQKDHRWINLILTIQDNLQKFSLSQKITALNLLARANMQNQLFLKIYNQIIGQLELITIDKNYKPQNLFEYNLQTASKLLWTIGKCQISTIKNVQIINDFIIKFFSSNKQIKVLKKAKQFDKLENKQNKTFITPFGITQIIWALSHLKIIDNQLIKQVGKLIKQNIEKFQTSQICLLLKSFSSMNMQRKRIVAVLFSQILQTPRFNQLQKLNNKSLKNLLYGLCQIRQSKANQIQKIQQQNEQFQTIKKQINKLQNIIYWLTQTILIKYQYNLNHKSSYFIFYCLKRSKNPYNTITHKPILSQIIKNIEKIITKDLIVIQKLLIQYYEFQNQKHLKQKSTTKYYDLKKQSEKNLMSKQLTEIKSFMSIIQERLWKLYFQLTKRQKQFVLIYNTKFLNEPPKHLKKQLKKDIQYYAEDLKNRLRKEQFNEQFQNNFVDEQQ